MLSKFADYKPKLRNPGRRQVPTFQTVTDRWWEGKSRELAPGSLKSYVPCVARAVDVFGGYRMNEITGGDIAALLNKHFTESRESPETHMDKTHVSP